MKFIVSLVGIAILAAVVYSYPLFYKQCPPQIAAENLLLARNNYFAGIYSLEDEQGVVLSSSLISERGKPSYIGNRLTAVVYARSFRLFGYSITKINIIALIFATATAIIYFLLTYRLFDLKTAVIFVPVYLLLPVTWLFSTSVGYYEVANFFFALALCSYFWNGERRSYLNLLLTGIFWGMASLARNAFLALAFAPVLHLLLLYRWQGRKKTLVFIVALFVVVTAFCIPPLLETGIIPNSYLNRQLEGEEFYRYSHVFPDPYTFHFEKEVFLARGEVSATELNFYGQGDGELHLIERIRWSLESLQHYLKLFFSLHIYGGPVVLILLGIGISTLIRGQRDLSIFCLIAICWLFIFHTFKGSSNFNHFAEDFFPIVVLVTAGTKRVGDMVSEKIEGKLRARVIVLILFLLFLTHLGQASRIGFQNEYNGAGRHNPGMLDAYDLAGVIEQKNIPADLIIAVGVQPSFAYRLNFFTDRSFIYFDSETVKSLIERDRLAEAFRRYGVEAIIGYDPQLSDTVSEKTGVSVIGTAVFE